MKTTYIILTVLLIVVCCACAQSERADLPDYEHLRENMVEKQISTRNVTDSSVLAAMRSVPRHLFVPEGRRRMAYADSPLPIGAGQTISQPYIVALMTELIEPGPDDTVLEIGTGSGYQAAVLGEIAAQVFTIEIIPELGHRADSLLDSLGYDNISVRVGDGYRGWPEQAPFDAIIVTAAPPKIPQPLKDQLAEGGRMVIPVGTDFQQLLLLEKVDGRIIETPVAPVRFVPMTGNGIKEEN